MKKLIILSACFAVFNSYAQPAPKPPAPPKPAQPASTAKPAADNSAADASLAKNWKYISSEEFGTETPATELQKNDALNLSTDKKAIFIKEGITKNGTWAVDKGKTAITFTSDAKETTRLRILKMEGSKIVIEWQDKDLIRHKMTYEAK